MVSYRVIAILLGFIFSGGVCADWQIQYQKSDGTWDNVRRSKTEEAARAYANTTCTRYRSPMKIVDTESGEEHALYCDARTGKITADGKPAPLVRMTEAEASKRAVEVRVACENHVFVSRITDCSCAEEKAKAVALQNEITKTANQILDEVVSKCPDRQRVQAWTYDSCMDGSSNRPDPEEFCRCTADTTAEGYMENPIFNLGHYDRLRDKAMIQCGPGRNQR